MFSVFQRGWDIDELTAQAEDSEGCLKVGVALLLVWLDLCIYQVHLAPGQEICMKESCPPCWKSREGSLLEVPRFKGHFSLDLNYKVKGDLHLKWSPPENLKHTQKNKKWKKSDFLFIYSSWSPCMEDFGWLGIVLAPCFFPLQPREELAPPHWGGGQERAMTGWCSQQRWWRWQRTGAEGAPHVGPGVAVVVVVAAPEVTFSILLTNGYDNQQIITTTITTMTVIASEYSNDML